MHEQMANRQLFQDRPKATDVIIVRMRRDHQVDVARVVVPLNVLDEVHSILSEPPIDHYHHLLARVTEIAVAKSDCVTALGLVPNVLNIDFKAHGMCPGGSLKQT